MYLLVKPNGGKYFRLNYRIHGKRKTLALGVYPEMSLAQARKDRDTARQKIAEGIDPMATKKTESNLFTDIALKWFKSKQHAIEEQTHIKKLRRFELHVFPIIGYQAIGDVKSPDVFSVVRPLVDQLKLDSAHRIRAEISEIFAYAIAHGYTDYDPAQAVAKQIPAHKVKHRAALTEPKDVAQLLKAIYSYEGAYIVELALKITPLIFQRPGEIRQMQWQDITGSGRYVFPSSRNDGRPMSDNTLRVALKTLGYSNDDMCPHGFRTTASTLLNEQGWSPDAIERQLSHMPKDQVRAAYNRAQYLDERRKMMPSWADYLDDLRAGSNVIQFKQAS